MNKKVWQTQQKTVHLFLLFGKNKDIKCVDWMGNGDSYTEIIFYNVYKFNAFN